MTPNQDTPKSAYLRNRPFLVVEIYIKPARTRSQDRTRTERKAWMNNNENLSYDEHPMVVDRIKDKHLSGAAIIIDLLQDVVIKNRLDDSDEDVLAHCKQKYRQMIEQGKNSWSYKTGAHLKDFESFKRSHQSSVGQAQTAPAVARAVSRKV